MFWEEFLSKIKKFTTKWQDSIQDSFLQILNSLNLAPLKKKYVRENQVPFMDKELQKAMIRSKLTNKFLKDRTESDKIAYWKQRKICVNTLRKTKKQYYSNLEASKVADNKKFWKIVKDFFSNNSNNFETTIPVENNIVISDGQKIAGIFIGCFCTIVPI